MLPPKTVESLEDESDEPEVPVVGVVVVGVCVPVGLVVGGLVGAGGGTALGGLTGNRDIVIPAESVVSFKLADDLAVQPQEVVVNGGQPAQ